MVTRVRERHTVVGKWTQWKSWDCLELAHRACVVLMEEKISSHEMAEISSILWLRIFCLLHTCCQLVDAGAYRRAVIIWVKTLHSKIKRSILAIYTGIIRSTEIRIHASPPFTNMSSSAIYSKSLARICTHGSSSHRHGKKWNEYPILNIIKAKGYEEMHKAWTL